MSMPVTPNPPVNTGSAPDMVRPQPTDAPGSDAAGWVKLDAPAGDGWSRIDDAGDDGAPRWRQT